MTRTLPELHRREMLAGLGSLGVAALACSSRGLAASSALLTKAVPTTGIRLPVIGMGTWITFNVGDDTGLRDQRVEVLRAFFEAGGGVIDSSPMYGSSEEVVGYCLKRLANTPSLFSATKVWTVSKWLGVRQMQKSEKLWGDRRFDLMQIHNLLDWKTHLETLKAWKAEGRVRHIGITTSHGRRHADLAEIMAREPLDFVQFTYNMVDREAERRLLPLAAERGIAVIVNRPFRRGALIDRLAGKPLPAWAADFDCANWAQFLLKFIVSHPAVTCAIPATSRVDHMGENMGAARGRLPGAETRRRMIRYLDSVLSHK